MKVMQGNKKTIGIHNKTLKQLALRSAGVGLANIPFLFLAEYPEFMLYLDALSIVSLFFYAASIDAAEDQKEEERLKVYKIKSQ